MPYRDPVAALEIKLRGLREARRELDRSIAETRRELRQHRRPRRRERLKTAAAVVALLALVLACLACAILPMIPTSCGCRADTTYTAIQTIKGAAELYVARSSQCPTVEDLVDRGLLSADQQTTDGWDRPFLIQCGARVYVSSAGPDGVHDTADDITSWRRAHRASLRHR